MTSIKNNTVAATMKRNKTWLVLGTGVGLGGLLWVLAAKKQAAVVPPPNPTADTPPKTDLKKLLRDTFIEQLLLSQSSTDESRLAEIPAQIQALQDKITRLPKIQKIIIERKLKDTKEELQDSLDKIKVSLAKISEKWLDFGITAEAKKQLEAKMAEKLSMRTILEAALKEQ